MGSHEVIMEVIKELGDPDQLSNGNRLVVLKLDRLLEMPESTVPEDTVFDSDTRVLSTSQAAFVSNLTFFAKVQCVAAAFAGCDEFGSALPVFLEVAKEVLKGAQTLVLVHNRNHVGDLVAWFPTITTLVLYHDLRLHLNQDFTQDGGTRATSLERIVGTTPALGCDHLYCCPTTVSNLLANNPKLSVIGTPIQEELMISSLDYLPSSWLVFKDCSHLVLGCAVYRQNNKLRTLDDVSPTSIPIAHHCFPSIRSLELTFASTATLDHVVRFTGLTHLSLIASTAAPSHPFSSHAVALLARLPLKQLSLANFSGVSVPTLAMTCPGLESLALLAGSARDEFIVEPIFSRLRRLRLSCTMLHSMLLALLRACPDLVELHLEEDFLSGAFLTGPGSLSRPRPSLVRLEQLTLRTRPPGCNSVVDLRVSPSDLDAALAELPALRRVRTDNFKIRFHLENGSTRQQPIALEWCTCAKCFSEYQKVSPEQQELWANVHFKKVEKGLAAPGMMAP